MSNGFDEASRQRNWLQRLADKIPGFRGFQNRELRRDVDKMQREYLAGRLTAIKRTVRHLARDYTDAGRLGELDRFERLDRRLEGLSQSIRFSDYGSTGLFDVEKIGESELAKLYEFDLGLMAELEGLTTAIEAIPRPGGESPVEAIDAGLEDVASMEEKWSTRATVINDIVETSG